CKFDQIPIWEGSEGGNKSTTIAVLAGQENFSDQQILTANEKEQQELVRGVWLYEIADLAGMKKSEVEKVKAFASRQVDRARPAYGRHRVDSARRCVTFTDPRAASDTCGLGLIIRPVTCATVSIPDRSVTVRWRPKLPSLVVRPSTSIGRVQLLSP